MKGLEKLVEILEEKAKKAAEQQYADIQENIDNWFKDDGLLNFKLYVEQHAEQLIKRALVGDKEALRDIGIFDGTYWDGIIESLAANNKEIVENERIKELERLVKHYQNMGR